MDAGGSHVWGSQLPQHWEPGVVEPQRGQGHRDGALSSSRKGNKQPHRGEWKPSASQGGAGSKGGSMQLVGDFLPSPRVRPNAAPGAPSAEHRAVCPPMRARRHCTLPALSGSGCRQSPGQVPTLVSTACMASPLLPHPQDSPQGTHISHHHRDALHLPSCDKHRGALTQTHGLFKTQPKGNKVCRVRLSHAGRSWWQGGRKRRHPARPLCHGHSMQHGIPHRPAALPFLIIIFSCLVRPAQSFPFLFRGCCTCLLFSCPLH